MPLNANVIGYEAMKLTLTMLNGLKAIGSCATFTPLT